MYQFKALSNPFLEYGDKVQAGKISSVLLVAANALFYNYKSNRKENNSEALPKDNFYFCQAVYSLEDYIPEGVLFDLVDVILDSIVGYYSFEDYLCSKDSWYSNYYSKSNPSRYERDEAMEYMMQKKFEWIKSLIEYCIHFELKE